jgi:hypothetical protein
MLAMVCHSTLAIWVYISISAVTLLTVYTGPPVGASLLAKICHSTLAIGCTYPSTVTATYGLRRPPVGASMLAMVCHSTLAIWVYISVAAVTATYGFALTAGHGPL